MSLGAKVQAAVFHSSTSRTAGFFSVEVPSLTTATLYVTILLMATGAGPCSTGGGFKVSSLMVLAMCALSRFRGSNEVAVFRRSVSRSSIERSFATVLCFAAAGACGLTALLAIEHSHGPTFLDLSFETASALGTVGLSTGVTSQLCDASHAIVIVLMLVGRLGPITLFIALSKEEEKPHLRYPSEDILIG
jgi:trk system potassium uptake protein TrkH